MIADTESGKMKWDENAFPVLRIGSLFACNPGTIPNCARYAE